MESRLAQVGPVVQMCWKFQRKCRSVMSRCDISSEVCFSTHFEEPSKLNPGLKWVHPARHTDDIMMFADEPVKWPVRVLP